jgi:hypothetical protein
MAPGGCGKTCWQKGCHVGCNASSDSCSYKPSKPVSDGRLPPNLVGRQIAAVAPNVLDRSFEAPAPNRSWGADLPAGSSLICSKRDEIVGRHPGMRIDH